MSLHTELLPDPLPPDPLLIAASWLAESWESRRQPNPNSMVLATADTSGIPSARVVLCKDIVPQPGYVVFYTNYLSRKGRELTQNPHAAIVMHWDHLHRQVRAEGRVVQASPEESDSYFASRAWQSRLSAWASAQSEPLESRAKLQAAVAAAAGRFGAPADPTAVAGANLVIPRPPHWGGFRLWATSVELWVEGEARIHDRARWTRSLINRSGGSFEAGPWTATRLQP